MNLALPVASGSAGLGRFAVNAAGAGLAINLAAVHVLPMIPANIRNADIVGDFGVQEVVLGAACLVGAMVANAIFNKVAG